MIVSLVSMGQGEVGKHGPGGRLVSLGQGEVRIGGADEAGG